MKIAIFSTYATVAPHFETELELAQRHLDDGDSVEVVSCYGELANCDFNPDSDPKRCHECRGRREAGLHMLEPAVQQRAIDVNFANCPKLKLSFDSLDELTKYKIENFDIGYAACSSLVSLIRDPEPDLQRHANLLADFVRSAAQTYLFTLQYIERESPDRIYAFNGRFASMRAVLRACQKAGVDCWIHERGCDNDHFELFPNHLPHDIAAVERQIRKLWNDASDLPNSNRQKIAAQWFHNRVNRVETNWHSFTKNQQAGMLPPNWNAQIKNVAIFCSSDDEFVAIGDSWQHKLYPNQVDAMTQIAESMLQADPECHLYLRVHPNLAKVQNKRKQQMLGLSYPNLTVIEPDAQIDTYELMRASDTVVSFGSSVGIEAVFWNKPSILLGPCFYQNLGGPYRPGSHAEAITLLTTDLEPTEKTGALMYGHWFQTRGQKYKFYEAHGLFEGTFKGAVVWAGLHENDQHKTLAQKFRREAVRLLSQLSRTG